MIITLQIYKNNRKKDDFSIKMDKSYYAELPKIIKNEQQLAVDGIYTLFEAKREPAFYFGGECHAAWEMVCILEENAGVSADDKVYSLSEGDVIFHQPMEFHKIWSENGSRPRVFIVSFDLSGEKAYKLKKGVYRLWEQPRTVLNAMLSLLRQTCADGQTAQEVIDYRHKLAAKNGALLQSVIGLLEAFMLLLAVSDERSVPVATGEKVRLYTATVGLLERHVYDRISIEEIAHTLGVSSATLKNCFSDYAGCGIHKYFLKIKIRTAIELLREGHTVSEVSERLQFSSPNYFSLVFKRETGGRTACSYRVPRGP